MALFFVFLGAGCALSERSEQEDGGGHGAVVGNAVGLAHTAMRCFLAVVGCPCGVFYTKFPVRQVIGEVHAGHEHLSMSVPLP